MIKRQKPQTELFREIIVDNFAGGGGASTGIALAIGRSVDVAINHDPAAISMHKVNHPDTLHYCESVWDVDPRSVAAGRPVALCWFSPDCKHFSKAKGGKPVEKHIRGLAWVAVRWAATARPRVIMLENVEEFKTWGPLLENGQPDPKKRGKTFQAFINALKRLGYHVDFRELRACDYGAPTIRKRFFLIARCDNKPIVWPKPTHGQGCHKPWRTAAEIIDWSLPCPSIFERKRPLAENTMRRIARGIQKFVVDSPEPFLIQVNHVGGNFRGVDLDKPFPTVTAKHGFGLVAPTLIQYHGEQSGDEVRGQSLNNPLMVVDASPRYALVSSFLTKFYRTEIGSDMRKPMPTITATGQHIGEVRAFLLKYYGADIGQDVNEPLHTVTTKDRFGLVTIHGQKYQIADIGMRMLEPRELFNAQGFPADYIIDRDCYGNQYPKSAQVARCGNAVPPPFAEALVRANLPEMCSANNNINLITGW